MSISNTLSTAVSGLMVSTKRAELASNNVANALTEGYSRREVQASEQVTGGVSDGVRVAGVTRAGDPALTSARRLSDAGAADSSVRSSAHQLLAQLGGSLDDPNSIFARVDALETSLAELAQTPESSDLQTRVVSAANAVATTFNSIATEVDVMREAADADIARQVATVNDGLSELQQLNRDFQSLTFRREDASALEDQRQAVLDQIGTVIAVKQIERGAGAIDLVTSNGLYLLEQGIAHELEFSPSPVISSTMSYDGGSGALSGLTLNGRDVTPGGPSNRTIPEGSLAAAFAVRDEIAPGFAAQIDGLARDLAERFQDPSVDPTLGVADPGLFTDAGAFVEAANEQGLAARLSVNARVDPDAGGAAWRIRDGIGATSEGPAGSGETIRAMLGALTESRTLPGSTGVNGAHSASEAAASLASLLGITAFDAQAQATSQAARTEVLQESELAVSAVDTDRELAMLLEIERAYAANARVIQTADSMLQQLLEL